MGRFWVKDKSKDKNNITKEIPQGEGLDAGQAKIIDTRQHLPDGILMICTYKLQKHNEQDRQTGA